MKYSTSICKILPGSKTPPTGYKRNLAIILGVLEVCKCHANGSFTFRITVVSINNVISATQTASKSLLDAIGEVYESQWTGHDQLYILTQSVDNLWQDFSHKLADQVLLPLNTYQSQFPEMRVTNSFHPTLKDTII